MYKDFSQIQINIWKFSGAYFIRWKQFFLMLSDLSKTDSYNIGNLKNRVSEKHFLAAAKVNFMCHFRLQYLKYLVIHVWMVHETNRLHMKFVDFE